MHTKFTVNVSQADAIRAGLNVQSSTIIQVDIAKYSQRERDLIADSLKGGHDLTGELVIGVGGMKFTRSAISLVSGEKEEFDKQLKAAAESADEFENKLKNFVESSVQAWISGYEKNPSAFPYADDLFMAARTFMIHQAQSLLGGWHFNYYPSSCLAHHGEKVSLSRAKMDSSQESYIPLGLFVFPELNVPEKVQAVQREFARKIPENLSDFRTGELMVASCVREISPDGHHSEKLSMALSFPVFHTTHEKHLCDLIRIHAEPRCVDAATFYGIFVPDAVISSAFPDDERAAGLTRKIREENMRRAAAAVMAANSGERAAYSRSRRSQFRLLPASACFAAGCALYGLVSCFVFMMPLFVEGRLQVVPALGFPLCGLAMIGIWMPKITPFNSVDDMVMMRDCAKLAFKEEELTKHTVKFYPAGTLPIVKSLQSLEKLMG
jgi:hypothetical protein